MGTLVGSQMTPMCFVSARRLVPSFKTLPFCDFAVGTWHFRFAYECVSEVAVRTLAAKAPSYAAIIELDRKVRDFPIPGPSAQLVTSSASPMPQTIDEEEPGPNESMSRFVMAYSREVPKSILLESLLAELSRSRLSFLLVLLYIHRSFFAQAIIESPVNPLKSQYAPSFLASYRASSTILQIVGAQYVVHPDLCERFWAIWTFAFSAAVRRSLFCCLA
jgi:hypothetical protein